MQDGSGLWLPGRVPACVAKRVIDAGSSFTAWDKMLAGSGYEPSRNYSLVAALEELEQRQRASFSASSPTSSSSSSPSSSSPPSSVSPFASAASLVAATPSTGQRPTKTRRLHKRQGIASASSIPEQAGQQIAALQAQLVKRA